MGHDKLVGMGYYIKEKPKGNQHPKKPQQWRLEAESLPSRASARHDMSTREDKKREGKKNSELREVRLNG